MTSKDEALKLALEALTATMSTHGFRDAIDEAHDKAITAIEEALAQPPEERNFCPRCGKRAGKHAWDVHTCSLPESEHHQFPMKRPDEDRIKGWNDALEHASSRFENEFKQAFGDTASSFAVWLKGLKR